MAGAAAAQLNIRGDVLRQIAAGSMFLHERLALPRTAAAGIDGDELLTQWRASLGIDGLARRLAWQGLDDKPHGPRAAHGNDDASATDDGWIELLADALAAPLPTGPRRYLADTVPAAFEELLLPFVEAARRRLQRDAGEALALLSEPAQIALERSLLLLLSHISLGVFGFEFALHQNLAGRFPWPDAAHSDRAYRRFVGDMLAGDLLELMREYAVLARLLSSWSCRWARSHAELVQRLQSDWPAMARAFALADTRCRVEMIMPYRSDPHNGGRAVSIITLCGGRQLVYKPRSVDMEQGLGELLAWANAGGFSQRFRPVALLPREGFGWMDHVACAPCAEPAQVAAFYHRTGGLLCLISLLQGTDFHHENLIACGDQPVVVDPETLFHPRIPSDVAADLGAGARRSDDDDDLARRLAETGFLPSGSGPDFSALGATEPIETPFRVARCEAANSDAMAVNYEIYEAPRRDNVPTLNGRPEPAAAHQDAIVAGYAEMSQLVLRNRPSLLAVIARFAGRRGRVVARSTNTCGLLLQASLRPELMRDGATRGVLFEQLRREAVRHAQPPRCWPILDAELRALELMDVPYLVNVCDRAEPCWASPLQEAIARVEKITPQAIDVAVERLARTLSLNWADCDQAAAAPQRWLLDAADQPEPLGEGR
jgi:type 2 lantibiotic biosynthesis protein LanM